MTRRFIPAYAGNSYTPKQENSFTPGSSPLTRGTHIKRKNKRKPKRFIPAYAGNSKVSVLPPPRVPVHPRLRGELGLSGVVVQHVFGSSPLTRGTHVTIYSNVTEIRFIPAYAGNSRSNHSDNWYDSVHPRLRGELTIEVMISGN